MRNSAILVVCVFSAVVMGAPGPGLSALVPREIEAEAEAAAVADQVAEQLDRDSSSAPAVKRAEIHERYRQAARVAAQRYTRLLRLLWSLKKLSPRDQEQATQATFKGAAGWLVAGDSRSALRLCDDLLDHTTDPSTRAQALALIVNIEGELGVQMRDISRRLSLFKKELPRLSPQERDQWRRWLQDIEAELRKLE